MRRLGFVSLIACSVLLVSAAARADAVVLKDGKRVEGKVKVQELGKWVVIELPTGVQKTILWDQIGEIEITAPPSAGQPPAAAPEPPADDEAPKPKPKPKKKLDKTDATAKVDKDGVSASAVHECGEGDPDCREEVSVALKGGDVSAKYDSVEDCSGEDAEVCQKKVSGEASKDGLSVGYSKESANRVTGPKTGASQFGLNANLLFGGNEMLTMTGFNAGFNLRLLTGGLFPNAKGGSWTGFFFEPAAQFSYVSTEVEVMEETIKSSSSAFMLGATAGLQWMSFGAQNQKTLQQGGFGLALGGQLGSFIPTGEGKATATYGASASILFPKYNPGTGSFVSEQINLFVLPSKDIFFLLIGAQKSWG